MDLHFSFAFSKQQPFYRFAPEFKQLNHLTMSQEAIDETDINLTKAPLYSIYDNDLDKDNDDNEIYNSLNSNIEKNKVNESHTIVHTPKPHLFKKILKLTASLLILSASGILYNQLGQHIHDNHILVPELASKPLDIGIKISNQLVFNGVAPKWLIYSIEGILFGLVQPIFDKYIFRSKPYSKDSSSTPFGIDTSSIVRAAVAFLGVSFAVRKIEWSSSIQASIAWSLLSPCLWLLLDGTLSGFFTGVFVASIASFSVIVFEGLPKNWYQDFEFTAVMLWLGNFFFFGLIIFGKIGRYLFE